MLKRGMWNVDMFVFIGFIVLKRMYIFAGINKI